MANRFPLWGQAGWASAEVVGETHYAKAIRALFGAELDPRGADITVPVQLIPDRNNKHDRNAVGVWSGSSLLGHLPRPEAARYVVTLTALTTRGLVPEVNARITGREWLAADGRPAAFDATIRLDLAEPHMLVPANSPPTQEHRLLPSGSAVQVVGQQQSLEALAPLLRPEGECWAYVTLHETADHLVEVRVGDSRVGDLSPKMSGELLPVLRHMAEQGVVTAARAIVKGNAGKSEVMLYVARVQDLPEGWQGAAKRPGAVPAAGRGTASVPAVNPGGGTPTSTATPAPAAPTTPAAIPGIGAPGGGAGLMSGGPAAGGLVPNWVSEDALPSWAAGPASPQVPVAGPAAGGGSGAGQLPGAGQGPTAGQIPVSGTASGVGQVPVAGQVAAPGQVPVSPAGPFPSGSYPSGSYPAATADDSFAPVQDMPVPSFPSPFAASLGTASVSPAPPAGPGFPGSVSPAPPSPSAGPGVPGSDAPAPGRPGPGDSRPTWSVPGSGSGAGSGSEEGRGGRSSAEEGRGGRSSAEESRPGWPGSEEGWSGGSAPEERRPGRSAQEEGRPGWSGPEDGRSGWSGPDEGRPGWADPDSGVPSWNTPGNGMPSWAAGSGALPGLSSSGARHSASATTPVPQTGGSSTLLTDPLARPVSPAGAPVPPVSPAPAGDPEYAISETTVIPALAAVVKANSGAIAGLSPVSPAPPEAANPHPPIPPAPTGIRFVVPQGWPTPPDGWYPPEGWTPDPAWPPAPSGWQWWVPTWD